jgi:hypothetical protein
MFGHSMIEVDPFEGATARRVSSSSARRRHPTTMRCICCGRGGRREPMGYGVIGSPTDSGSVSLGSSPGTPAPVGAQFGWVPICGASHMAPLCSGLARRPLKAVAPVRIRSGLQRRTTKGGCGLTADGSIRSPRLVTGDDRPGAPVVVVVEAVALGEQLADVHPRDVGAMAGEAPWLCLMTSCRARRLCTLITGFC